MGDAIIGSISRELVVTVTVWMTVVVAGLVASVSGLECGEQISRRRGERYFNTGAIIVVVKLPRLDQATDDCNSPWVGRLALIGTLCALTV
jgi:hypothetical protein